MRLIKFGLQPAILVSVLFIWSMYNHQPLIFLLLIVSVQTILGTLEYCFPARRDWVQPAREKLVNISIVIVVTTGTILMAVLYDAWLAEPLAAVRVNLHLDVWPNHWPVMAQLFLVFFLSEFIWYWVHRAEHRWGIVWRLSGHGAHHAFKRLGAINFGANHPLEMFLLVLPSALVALTFGVGIAAAGAAVLTSVQASIAHANLNMNTRWIGLLFTTNTYHIKHHSIIVEESNSNFGCSAIVWDRVFGTFRDGATQETGIGPTEPSLWQKFLMPVREPNDATVAP